jgi:hypothetical protein
MPGGAASRQAVLRKPWEIHRAAHPPPRRLAVRRGAGARGRCHRDQGERVHEDPGNPLVGMVRIFGEHKARSKVDMGSPHAGAAPARPSMRAVFTFYIHVAEGPPNERSRGVEGQKRPASSPRPR